MRGFLAALCLTIGATSAHPSDKAVEHDFAPALFQKIPLLQSNGTWIEEDNEARTTPAPGSFDLLERQMGNCPTSYYTCSTNAAACCGTASYCSNDGNGNLACCKSGATCTGTANYATATGVVSTLTTTSSGIIVVITTTLSVTSVTGSTATTTAVTYVSNSLFPYFPIYGTSFANAAQCTSAYSSCTSDFQVCTSELEGSIGTGFAVTINVPGGGGVTVGAASTTLASAAASSVCASLAGQACPGSSGTCSNFGTTSGSFSVTKNGGSRPEVTAAVGVILGAGMAAGWVL